MGIESKNNGTNTREEAIDKKAQTAVEKLAAETRAKAHKAQYGK